MTRLLFLLGATLAVILVVLSVYGRGNLRAQNQADRNDQTASQEISVLKDVLTEVPEPPESNGADGPPPADLVQAAEQTPERVQEFPGPDLRPSPEYDSATPEQDALLADADGPVLYVSGSRVNFRSGPSTGDRVVGALNGGSAVEALGPVEDDWVHIRDQEGRIGYMSGQFLSRNAP